MRGKLKLGWLERLSAGKLFSFLELLDGVRRTRRRREWHVRGQMGRRLLNGIDFVCNQILCKTQLIDLASSHS